MNDATIESIEVSWKALDIEISGTITCPVAGTSLPGVILVAGSGPTDRDWCSPLLPGSNGSGKLLAEVLARKGYATLRYDKMASGPHVGENLPKFAGKVSMQTHVDELAGAVTTLISRENVSRNHIFVLTNSEGAIHAVNYQLGRDRVAFKGLILTGAPGRSVGDVGREQIVAQGRSVQNAEVILKHYDTAISQFISGGPVVLDDSLPEGLKRLLMSLEAPANLPFSRELWTYSLSEHIGEITEPILIIIGKKDIQVNWERDGMNLESALLRNRNSEFVYPENANHVLKCEKLPLDQLTAEKVAAEYNSPDSTLDRESVDSILLWLERNR